MRPESQAYSPPSVWLYQATGNYTLFQGAWTWLKESNRLMPIVDAESNLGIFHEKCWQEYPDVFPNNLENIFLALLGFKDRSEHLDLDRISVYKWVTNCVGHTLKWIEAKEEPSKVRRLLSAFGAMAPRRFETLVRERHFRVLVILAHFFAIMKAVDDVWRIRSVPELEVFGIQSLLPERWQWAMAWQAKKSRTMPQLPYVLKKLSEDPWTYAT